MRVFDVSRTRAFDGVHQTSGIDVYVTGERTILLDSQVTYVRDGRCLCNLVCSGVGSECYVYVESEKHLAYF